LELILNSFQYPFIFLIFTVRLIFNELKQVKSKDMKLFCLRIAATPLLLLMSYQLFSQDNASMQEFGLTTGAFTNFPANQDYLKDNTQAFYLAPYIRTGKHEFSAGILYPLKRPGLYFTYNDLDPRAGAIAGYKVYLFNVYSRENLFIHYSFQYFRFTGNYDSAYNGTSQLYHATETDIYINNVIGLGYNLFFDYNARFGLFYTLDYIISQAGYRVGEGGATSGSWITKFAWNNLSTHFGLSFKLTSLQKKDKK
jgi:hypothetical protein